MIYSSAVVGTALTILLNSIDTSSAAPPSLQHRNTNLVKEFSEQHIQKNDEHVQSNGFAMPRPALMTGAGGNKQIIVKQTAIDLTGDVKKHHDVSSGGLLFIIISSRILTKPQLTQSSPLIFLNVLIVMTTWIRPKCYWTAHLRLSLPWEH